MQQKRIALLIPHTDTVLEADLQRELGGRWIIHTTRLWLDSVGEEAEKRMVDIALHDGIRTLEGITSFDHAIFGCTSASVVYGRTGMDHIERLLSDRFRCPGISAFGAAMGEISAHGASSIALLTPYTAEVNCFMEHSIKQFGVKTIYANGLNLSKDTEIAQIQPESILSFAINCRDRLSKAELLFLSCTNLRALEIREELENLLGIPVVTSNYSIIQYILRRRVL